ncbi:hypothetical protein ADL15_40100 [Actinoplanes awajinensis subsp. mycoplanecinus]|uniref:Uncharacterized protein n=1 Tax=Actinoplanes awajinensis subsp. mycoplanecinus TaxID=135947 RepID=A0A117MMM9_9ACTN|nr:hypothetical protein ADL15_40100 [Actinoplanes awajinensis subsp. mycoplanecinus]
MATPGWPRGDWPACTETIPATPPAVERVRPAPVAPASDAGWPVVEMLSVFMLFGTVAAFAGTLLYEIVLSIYHAFSR